MLDSGVQHVNMAQLHHVWNEVQLLKKEQDQTGSAIREPLSPLDTPSPSPTQPTTCALLPWQAGYSPPVLETPQSSLSHTEISRLIRDLSVAHRNEVTLENGHIVDILMPMNAFEFVEDDDANSTNSGTDHESTSRKMATARGVVMEYDGPFHFESYANVSALFSCVLISYHPSQTVLIYTRIFNYITTG